MAAKGKRGTDVQDEGAAAAVLAEAVGPLDAPAGDAPDPLGPESAPPDPDPGMTAPPDPDPGMTAPPVIPVPIPPPTLPPPPPPQYPITGLGETVLYLMPNGGAQPAIVTRVCAEGVVDLVALHAPMHNAYGGAPQCTTFRSQVKPGADAGCWRPLPPFSVADLRALEPA